MSTHNIYFYRELTKIILQLSSDTLLICYSAVILFFTVAVGYTHACDPRNEGQKLPISIVRALVDRIGMKSLSS